MSVTKTGNLKGYDTVW